MDALDELLVLGQQKPGGSRAAPSLSQFGEGDDYGDILREYDPQRMHSPYNPGGIDHSRANLERYACPLRTFPYL